MFGDKARIDEMLEKLNRVSPTFCGAKWLHATIHLGSGETHSCYLPPVHKIEPENLIDNPGGLHNTPEKMEQRQQMMKGERPSGCHLCWAAEDDPNVDYSDRQLRSVDDWIMPHLDQLVEAPLEKPVYPTYLEISFSNKCNFKCSYCSPQFSTSWKAEIDKFGPYKLTEGPYLHESHYRLPLKPDQHNPYVEAFWQWLPDLYPHLQYLRVTGGEPLIVDDTYKLLNWIGDHPNPNLVLSVNSNFGLPEKYQKKLFADLKKIEAAKAVRSVDMFTSVDTYGAHAEYLRTGMDFSEFDKSIREYLTEFSSSSFSIMCTFNALSVIGFGDFLQWLLELRRTFHNGTRRVYIDTPHLNGPSYLNAKTLTPRYWKLMEQHIAFCEAHLVDNEKQAGFTAAEVARLRRVLSFMKNIPSPDWLTTARRDFYFFFKEHDRRRRTSFLDVFPEMEDHWEMCRQFVEL